MIFVVVIDLLMPAIRKFHGDSNMSTTVVQICNSRDHTTQYKRIKKKKPLHFEVVLVFYLVVVTFVSRTFIYSFYFCGFIK